ncbi:hypothetical protein PR048_011884 [Dryococelus australis]|uniref:Uncharacterized protein n=1 Tax=Dryococelus australis TaxID=614101 RepID=A0ABQ9HMX1_9NEOP|nr:hypothetical protein PR048_011884 [Dryococelus australis]
MSENVTSVHITFAVVSHSFIRLDRMFDRIEKLCRERTLSLNLKREAYRSTDLSEFKSLLKHGKQFSAVNFDVLSNKVSVKAEKVTDVRALLRKHYGDDWESMANLLSVVKILQQPEIADGGEEVGDIIWEQTEDLRLKCHMLYSFT